MKVRQYDQTPPARNKRRPSVVLVVLAVATALGASACTNDGEGSAASGGSTQTADKSPAKTIPQPILDKNLQVAPEDARVDVAMPSFPDPTSVTNPLFPVSKQKSVLLLGRVDGKPFRTEVTLLPYTRIIEWEGQLIETLTSQYVAYLDGRITEVAVDQYAQADDGSVWYFGEDVSDFRHGAIVTKEGTWTVGKDGPAAMVMPGDPKVGVVHRAENIPGIAFEEVTVRSVDQTLDGPVGPVKGGMVGEELHMDGSTSEKVFGPGYGEFYTAHGGDIEALAVAVPTDALPGRTPAELLTIKGGTEAVFDAAESKDWSTASAAVDDMTAAWDAYSAGEVPKMIKPRMTRGLKALAIAVDARNSERARRSAVDTAQWSLDLQLRYRPPAEIDLARFDLWAAQLQLDAAAGKGGAANGDFFTLDLIRDRILHVLDPPAETRINLLLEDLETGVFDKKLAAVATAAGQLRDTVAGIAGGGHR